MRYILLLFAVFTAGCGPTMTEDANGNKVPASLVALEDALMRADTCLLRMGSQYEDSYTTYLSAFPATLSETSTALLLMNWNETRKSAIRSIIDGCFAPVVQVALQFNLTDRQIAASKNRLIGMGIGFGGGYLIAGEVASILRAGQGGDEYNILGNGARQIQVRSDTDVNERGWTVFGGDRTNTAPESNPALVGNTQSPPISNSNGRDENVIGNTMNVNLPVGKNASGSAITDIPNFSPDPAINESLETTNGGSVTSQPVTGE